MQIVKNPPTFYRVLSHWEQNSERTCGIKILFEIEIADTYFTPSVHWAIRGRIEVKIPGYDYVPFTEGVKFNRENVVCHEKDQYFRYTFSFKPPNNFFENHLDKAPFHKARYGRICLIIPRPQGEPEELVYSNPFKFVANGGKRRKRDSL